MKIAGQKQPELPPLLAGKFAFDGAIDASQTAVCGQEFPAGVRPGQRQGSPAITLEPKLAIDADIAADRLDLDRWLAGLKSPPPAAPATPPPAGATAVPPPPPAPSSAGGALGQLGVEIGEVVYKKQAIRNVALKLEARGGAVAVPKLTATLPGDMVLEAKSTLAGRSQPADGGRRLQPGRAEAARDAGLAGRRRLVRCGRQAAARQP